ncbi:MAG TPA: nucleotidyltransferase family protein [Candidatus Polarisedimenticolia bacterium]|nr:nucleotidyltransferase family protein [Candidatus Polarisedimenticolia bacterium]
MAMTSGWREPPPFELQRSIVTLLRGEVPREAYDASLLEGCLRRYECGGYLHAQWGRGGSREPLPATWAEPIARAHRKTAIDNLGALAEFRAVGEFLARHRIPFVLLKGAAYLVDLYDDPGERALTDIDVLVRPDDVHRIARHLAEAGYEGIVDPWYPEYRRFEMVRNAGARSRFEFHWHLGQSFRQVIDQRALWDGAREGRLDGIPCRLLGPGETILYHVGHLADHYYGPTLKWIVDLRAMLSRYKPDPVDLAGRAGQWRLQVALYLALLHLDKLFPGESPPDLMKRVTPGRARRAILTPFLSSSPVELLDAEPGTVRRLLVRPIVVDSPLDALRMCAHIAGRPVVHLARRLQGPVPLPWEPAD